MAMAVLVGGGHGNRPGQVLGVVAGGGEDCPFLSGDVLSHPRSSRGGLDGDDAVVGPLGRGHGNHLSRVLGVAAGGGGYD